MSYKLSVFLTIIGLLCLPACTESVDKKEITEAPVYVTNAQYVLNSLKDNNSSAVAFQVKPVRSTACEHMYIEFGKKNAQGEWSPTNILYPGKDSRESFGKDILNDQIHFAEVGAAGEYGVIAFGCKPYGRDLKTHRGLMAEFKVEHGKLNYVGEVTLLPAGTDFATVYVVNRSKFAREQIKVQLPELEQYFHENIMEMYLPKLSKEQQAALDEFEARKKALQPLFDMRNQTANEYNIAAKEWNDWMTKYGGVNNPNKTAQAERESLKIFKRMEALEDRLELHDKFIDEGRSLKYAKQYVFLLDDIKAKKALYNAAKDKGQTGSEDELFSILIEAEGAFNHFKEINP